LAQVESESGFKPRSENLNYSSAERIQKVFGKNRFPTVESAQPYVNNPEALANYVYAKTDGNSEPGDGWKYRGRGFLQHTGKNQYKAIAKYTGIDVVADPDKLNDPEVAAKAIPWFFLEYKRKKPQQLENISDVNKAVGFAGGKEESEKREQLAQAYTNQLSASPVTSSSGTQLASASQENQNLNMQADMSANKSKTTVNNTQVNVATSTQKQHQEEVDDRPAILRK